MQETKRPIQEGYYWINKPQDRIVEVYRDERDSLTELFCRDMMGVHRIDDILFQDATWWGPIPNYKAYDMFMHLYLASQQDTYQRHDYSRLPESGVVGIQNYIQKGYRQGSFLSALLSNDLCMAHACADLRNLPLIPIYMSYLRNECPGHCWGSKQIMEAWLSMFGSGVTDENIVDIKTTLLTEHISWLKQQLEQALSFK